MKTTLSIISIFFMLFILSGCKSGTEKDNKGNELISPDVISNPNSASGNGDSTQLPKFQFEQETHDFGTIAEGEKVTYSFKFKNVGKADLLISSATGSCGCTEPNYPKRPIRSGESSTIDVTFNSEGKKGFTNKTITLMANTQPPTKVLTIKANVKTSEN